jgi:hypothetical protein
MFNKITEDINQDYYQQQFPNDGQRFVAWYLRNIHLRDVNQAKDEITDGPEDKQIDAIFVDDDNSTVYIIQGKFYGADSVDAEPLREVLSSWVNLKDLVKLQETGNDKLKWKLSEVALAFDDEYDIAFELVTTGQLTKSAHNDLAVFQKEIAESEELSANIHLIDNMELKRRYDMALEKENPVIKHTIKLEEDKFMKMHIAGNNVILAAVPLKECIKFPGIKDGTLFQKNVRQSLGLSNRVNKGIQQSIYGDNTNDFFFYHNGITAICNKLEIDKNQISCTGLSIVNGCQSLNTILSCSEKVKTIDDSYVLFRFYEVSQRDRADKISVSTNSQSAVKPRDLRSNDKRVLNLKKSFEQKFPNGHLLTKRGEESKPDKDKKYILDLSELGKYLISWHSQRPNIAYSETKIFDKYFEQLFKRDYKPEKAQALNFWMQEVLKRWEKGSDNPLNLNESLLAMRAYAPYHHLYAISVCFGVSNSMPMESVPDPFIAYEKIKQKGLVDQIVDLAGRSLNFALESAANEPQPGNRVFSPQNWIKAKKCLAGIRAAVSQSLNMLPMMNADIANELKNGLKLEREDFQARWAAD